MRGGQRVTVLDDLSTGDAANLGDLKAGLVTGSVLDAPLVHRLLADHDAVVHLAGATGVPTSLADPVGTYHVNTTGTLNVLEAGRQTGAHVILASSAAVYGSPTQMPVAEDLPVRPASPYAASKVGLEAYGQAYAEAFDVAVTTFRFFNVYGPLQLPGQAYAAVIPAFMDAVCGARPLEIHGDGQQTRDFIHVDTVVEVLTRTVRQRRLSPQPVNLGARQAHSILDVADALQSVVGQPLERRHVAARDGDVRHSRADTARLDNLIPDRHEVSLAEGLASTWQWFSERMSTLDQ